jgi:predicted aspartyl protease
MEILINMFQLQWNGTLFQGLPQAQTRQWGSKVFVLTTNLVQGERNIVLKGKVFTRDMLCLLDTGASHNFVTWNSAERIELQLVELKAPIEVHFADWVPHPIILQAKDVPFQLGN